MLAAIAAVGTTTGAIAGVVALLPKSPDTLTASVEALAAVPEVSLEQYDVRAGTPIGGRERASVPAPTVAYRLAADTTTLPSATSSAQGESARSQTTPPPTTTGGAGTTTPTGTSAGAGPGDGTTTSTAPVAPVRTGPAPSSGGGERPGAPGPPRPRAKRAGAKIRLKPLGRFYPKERSEPAVQTPGTFAPDAPQRAVEGAVVSEGAGVPKHSVSTVAGLLASGAVEPMPGVAPGATGSSPSKESSPLPEPRGEPAPRGEESAAPAHPTRIVLPRSCRSGSCGATQEIERALTYDPNPIKAAQAVAAVFDDSRAEVVQRRLYPVGAMVTYTVSLRGFAHRFATLEWSLLGSARKRPLPRPWWRNIVVARIRPTVDDETLSGSFWVPMPPQRGDYQVHLVVLDAAGVEHSWRDTAPPFH